MNKLKLFFLSIITPLLCIGVSFGASGPEFVINIDSSNLSNFLNGPDNIYLSSVFTNDQIAYIVKYGQDYLSPVCLSYAGLGFSRFEIQSLQINNNYGSSNGYYMLSINNGMPFSDIVCFNGNFISSSSFRLTQPYGDSNTYLSLKLFVPVSNDCSSVESDLNTCVSNYNTLKSDYNSLSGNFNTCLDRVNTMNGQVASLSGSLSSCQSDLANCTNGCDVLVNQCQSDKSALQSSLSGCNEEKESLQNYNSSLSNQLNECLSNGGSGSLSLTGCNSFSVFWNQDGNPFSLPITNNLFLPNGLRSVITGGVQSIEQVDKPIYDFASSEDLSNSFNKILLFMFAMPMFALFVYYIKKYLFTLFMPEK